MRSLTIRLGLTVNSLTESGRTRNRDAKRAALVGGPVPSYLSGTFTAWAYSLQGKSQALSVPAHSPNVVAAYINGQYA